MRPACHGNNTAAPVSEKHPNQKTFDGQVGMRLLPRHRDLVAGDVTTPQEDPAHAHKFNVAH